MTPDPSPFLLGQISGQLKGIADEQRHTRDDIKAVHTRIDGIDARLRHVEQRAAAIGAVSGGAMGIGMALVVESLKAWVRRGGSGT